MLCVGVPQLPFFQTPLWASCVDSVDVSLRPWRSPSGSYSRGVLIGRVRGIVGGTQGGALLLIGAPEPRLCREPRKWWRAAVHSRGPGAEGLGWNRGPGVAALGLACTSLAIGPAVVPAVLRGESGCPPASPCQCDSSVSAGVAPSAGGEQGICACRSGSILAAKLGSCHGRGGGQERDGCSGDGLLSLPACQGGHPGDGRSLPSMGSEASGFACFPWLGLRAAGCRAWDPHSTRSLVG